MKKIMGLLVMLVSFFMVGCSSNGSIFESLKTTDEKNFKDVTISANYVTSYITPSGFEYDKLIEKNYTRMTITLVYYVSYKKTWTSLDFLYNGAPKYDVSIYDDNDMGGSKTGLTTTTTPTRQSYSLTYDIVNLTNNKLRLVIGSINIQNDIYFTDISVSYRCVK